MRCTTSSRIRAELQSSQFYDRLLGANVNQLRCNIKGPARKGRPSDNYRDVVSLLLFGDCQFIPVTLADELGQAAAVARFATDAVAKLALLGCEGDLNNVLLVNHDLLLQLDVIEFDGHFKAPLLNDLLRSKALLTIAPVNSTTISLFLVQVIRASSGENALNYMRIRHNSPRCARFPASDHTGTASYPYRCSCSWRR